MIQINNCLLVGRRVSRTGNTELGTVQAVMFSKDGQKFWFLVLWDEGHVSLFDTYSITFKV